VYTRFPAFVLGYHGCDKRVAEQVLAGSADLKGSQNDYDWLGHGIYFWENDPARALAYAKEVKRRDESIKTPAVVGAIIDLGQCLDLLDAANMILVRRAHQLLVNALEQSGSDMPENLGGSDRVLRHLDCAVIETFHESCRVDNLPEADSVRGVFVEGGELYPNSGFREKNHIQICVRRTRCIRGYFRVRESALR